ncbi:MAG: radical SAM protein [Omnitrophica bacterium]|nr:radical SAM protein [Candidatus Omnitrophota bacterium]
MIFPDSFSVKLEKNNIPVHASFELTWKCNTNCLHCYQNPYQGNELKLEEIKDILDQLAKAGCLFLTFTGGEPLMREDFLDIARYAYEKKFALELKTNGTLIDSYMAKQINKLNFLEVDISIYGASTKTHDSITQSQGSFTKVISAVKYLKAQGLQVWLMLTLMKQNIEELGRVQLLADELGVNFFYSPQVYAKHDKGKQPLEFRLSDSDLKSLYLRDKEKELAFFKEPQKPGLICQFGRTACTINPLGEVYPCVGAPISAGNLREQPFKDVWQKSHFLQDIRLLKRSDLEKCSSCRVSSYCFRCPGAAFLEEGDIKASYKEACRLAKIKKEVLG